MAEERQQRTVVFTGRHCEVATLVQETTVEGFIRRREDDARELHLMYERIKEHFY